MSYVADNARSRSSFSIWLTAIKHADWEVPEDILETFDSADLLGKGSDRVVFDSGGNRYRMMCKYVFGQKQIHLFICWIGTHAEYDGLCNKNKQYTMTDF